MSNLILSGGDTEKDLQFKRSEVNHLRLLLGWMRCEYMLDEDMQRGYADGTKWSVDNGHISQERGEQSLTKKANEIKRVPLYVRQGVKMLTKMLREHEKLGDTFDGEVMKNRLTTEPKRGK